MYRRQALAIKGLMAFTFCIFLLPRVSFAKSECAWAFVEKGFSDLESLIPIDDRDSLKTKIKENRWQDIIFLFRQWGKTKVSQALENAASSLFPSPESKDFVLMNGDHSTEVYKSVNHRTFFKPFVHRWISTKYRGVQNSNPYAEVLAYQFSQILDLGLVPITILKKGYGSLQFEVSKEAGKIDDSEFAKLHLFDFLINNRDRNNDNYFGFRGQIVAIDHGLAFQPESSQIGGEPPKPLLQIPFDGMQIIFYKNLKYRLTDEKIRELMSDNFSTQIIEETLERRRKLLTRFKDDFGDI